MRKHLFYYSCLLSTVLLVNGFLFAQVFNSLCTTSYLETVFKRIVQLSVYFFIPLLIVTSTDKPYIKPYLHCSIFININEILWFLGSTNVEFVCKKIEITQNSSLLDKVTKNMSISNYIFSSFFLLILNRFLRQTYSIDVISNRKTLDTKELQSNTLRFDFQKLIFRKPTHKHLFNYCFLPSS